ncbi:expressed unknown protein [Seminavis robusta]|uniref:Uncharacterized protein n=1 Tax=Seminavis robusta TaxID=568900 RepID=A0A9N8H3L7_9STRA|nr:expressed unknown protein [Seminavis robusta]|eukprot:Sro90_g047401.1  (199) ;mRNA; f:75142-75738
MFHTASAAFKEWLDVNSRYPFNEIRKTRQSYELKYVLLMDETDRANRYSQYFCLKVKYLPSVMIEQLIMEEKAVPMTPDMTWILETMTGWGVRQSSEWYHEVLALLALTVEEGDPVTKKELCRLIVRPLMREALYNQFGVWQWEARELLLSEWTYWFNTECWRKHKHNLSGMVVSSQQYIAHRAAFTAHHGGYSFPMY